MILSVPDASCGHCTAAIQKAVAEAGGRAEVDLDRRTVAITGLDQVQAMRVLNDAGYPAQPVPGS